MSVVQVAVGVVLDRDQNILITQRAQAAHQGGLWEFPGGKVEAQESVLTALKRELLEELGIEPVRTSTLIQVAHDYGDKKVLLDVHIVWEFTGEPTSLEGQPMAWVDCNQLDSYTFPAANVPIVDAVLSLLKK